MPALDSERRTAVRLAIVEEHVTRENQHDLEGIMQTFGASARYDDEPWDAHYVGREGVRAFYSDLMQAMPDFRIDVEHRHVSDAAIVLEVVISGRHLGAWRGLPPTGRNVKFPLCGVFTFDDDDRLAGEKIYYDRATILRQLGVFHEPDRLLGRINALLMHPFTMAKIATRTIFGRAF
jgi:steroid delta-isomerase-like uncharacterized protein